MGNIHWLIPHYLLQKNYGAYFWMVFLLIIAYLLIQSLYDAYLYGFVLDRAGMPICPPRLFTILPIPPSTCS